MSGDEKLKAKISQLGRSMVEMLGVLAIIGVLSVGAIAGYSSAMTKHKLNKQAEQLNWLLNILYQYKAQWRFGEMFVHLVPYYKKLGLIPEDMIKDDSVYIYDAFGLKMHMATNDCYDKCNTVMLMYEKSNEHFSFEMCQNMFTTAKAFHEQIERFGTHKSNTPAPIYYGDKYCKGSHLCLKDLDMEKIYDVCQRLNSDHEFQPYFTILIND